MRVPISTGTCHLCGRDVTFEAEETAVLLRDALCPNCFSSLRNSDVAHMLVRTLCGTDTSLAEEKARLERFRIWNTASYGVIHQALCHSPNYLCSEYFDDVPNGDKRDSVYCVDLRQIPFESNSFDAIISEDVFEHIADYPQAFREIYRVLKPGGVHIFTVPVHEGRATVSRKGNPNVVYHGDFLRDSGALVVTDFGDDLPAILKQYGFSTKEKVLHRFFAPEEITNADESYEEYLGKREHLECYFKYNSIVFISKKPKRLFGWGKRI